MEFVVGFVDDGFLVAGAGFGEGFFVFFVLFVFVDGGGFGFPAFIFGFGAGDLDAAIFCGFAGCGFAFVVVIIGVGAAEVVVLADFDLLVFGFEGDHAVALVAHVGADAGWVVPDDMAVQTFVVFVDLAVEVMDKTFEVDEIISLRDEQAVTLEHVVDVCVDVGFFLAAEQAAS